MRSLSLFDLAFLRAAATQFAAVTNDSFEEYDDESLVNGLDGGEDSATIAWTAPYVDRNLFMGLQALDEMETYTNGAALQGLNNGFGFSAAYQDHEVYIGLKDVDDMESYSDSAALNGLNGGTGWVSAYVNHNF